MVNLSDFFFSNFQTKSLTFYKLCEITITNKRLLFNEWQNDCNGNFVRRCPWICCWTKFQIGKWHYSTSYSVWRTRCRRRKTGFIWKPATNWKRHRIRKALIRPNCNHSRKLLFNRSSCSALLNRKKQKVVLHDSPENKQSTFIGNVIAPIYLGWIICFCKPILS